MDRHRDAAVRARDDFVFGTRLFCVEYTSYVLDKVFPVTPQFWVPEIVRGAGRVVADPRSDVVEQVEWASGALEHAIQVELRKQVGGEFFAKFGDGVDESHFGFIEVGRSKEIFCVWVDEGQETGEELRIREIASGRRRDAGRRAGRGGRRRVIGRGKVRVGRTREFERGAWGAEVVFGCVGGRRGVGVAGEGSGNSTGGHDLVDDTAFGSEGRRLHGGALGRVAGNPRTTADVLAEAAEGDKRATAAAAEGDPHGGGAERLRARRRNGWRAPKK